MPKRALIDTNVLFSVLRRPDSASASRALVEAVLGERLRAVNSTATILELLDVLLRPEFAFSPLAVADFVEVWCELCEWAHPSPSSITLRDPGDQKWMNLLQASHADCLATHNLKDFRPAITAGYPIAKPAEALRLLGIE